MDTQRLVKIAEKVPSHRDEIIKIAQELSGYPETPAPAPVSPAAPAPQAVPAAQEATPGISNYIPEGGEDDTIIEHHITFRVQVPDGTNITELTNIMADAIKSDENFDQKGYKILGYSFDERSRGGRKK